MIRAPEIAIGVVTVRRLLPPRAATTQNLMVFRALSCRPVMARAPLLRCSQAAQIAGPMQGRAGLVRRASASSSSSGSADGGAEDPQPASRWWQAVKAWVRDQARSMVAGVVTVYAAGSVFWAFCNKVDVEKMDSMRRQARHSFVHLDSDAIVALDNLSNALDTLDEIRARLTPALYPVHWWSLALLLGTHRVKHALDVWEAHLRNHIGAMLLLEGDGERATVELKTSRKRWNGMATGTPDKSAEEAEALREEMRAQTRIADVEARFATFDEAARQYEAAMKTSDAEGFVAVRIRNNLAVAKFAEGLESDAVDDMETARDQVSGLVVLQDLPTYRYKLLRKAAGALRAKLDDDHNRDARKRSWLEALQALDSGERNEIEEFAEKCRGHQVDTLIDRAFWFSPAHTACERVEQLDRAKHILRKQLTARANLVHMAACASESDRRFRLADYVVDLLDVHTGGDFKWLSDAYEQLDLEWLRTQGAARVLTVVGAALVALVERDDIQGTQATNAMALAGKCFAEVLRREPKRVGSRMFRVQLLAGAWKARMQLWLGDRKAAVASVGKAEAMFKRLEAPVGGKLRLLDSPRDLRIAAMAYVVAARAAADNQTAERYVDAAAKLLNGRNMGKSGKNQSWESACRVSVHPVLQEVETVRAEIAARPTKPAGASTPPAEKASKNVLSTTSMTRLTKLVNKLIAYNGTQKARIP